MHTIPIRKCMENSDNHERNLGAEEDSNDYDKHQGGALGVPLQTALLNPTKIKE